MPRNFKRPSRIVLYLARERYRLLDGLVIFGAGLAFNNLWVGIGVAMIGAGTNMLINHFMESYR